MKNAIISLFALGWIDIFNPVAISMVMVLLSMVRKRQHVLIYVFGAYIAYVSASIAIYFGVDRYLLELFEKLKAQHLRDVGFALTIVGIMALAGGIVMTIFIIKAIVEKRHMTFERVLFIKSVAPWFILLLSFGSTFSCMFFAYPMLSFITILALNKISTISALWLISLFCVFSIITTLGIYFLATRSKDLRIKRLINKIYLIMNGFCLYSIPVVLTVISCFSLISGINFLAVT